MSLLVFREPTYDPHGVADLGPPDLRRGRSTRSPGRRGSRCRSLFTTPFSLFGDDAGDLAVAGRRARGRARRRSSSPTGSPRRFYGHVAGAVAALCLAAGQRVRLQLAPRQLRGPARRARAAGRRAPPRRPPRSRRSRWGAAAALLRPEVWPILAALRAVAAARAPRRAHGGARVRLAARRSRWRGSCPSTSARATSSAAPRARGNPCPARPARRTARSSTTFTNSAQALTYGGYAGRGGGARAGVAATAASLGLAAGLRGADGHRRAAGLERLHRQPPLRRAADGAAVRPGGDRLGLGRERRAAAASCSPCSPLAALPGLVGAAQTAVAQPRAHARARRDLRRRCPASSSARAAARRVLRCGQVYTGPFQTQVLAYRLHLRQSQVGIVPEAPGTILDVRRNAARQQRRASRGS